MTAALRVTDTGVRPARWNIAVTAALLQLHSSGRLTDTIRFHRYPRSILIGRHQSLSQEVEVERCRDFGIELARRVTGGGAVYMSPGILAWDVVAGRYRFGMSLEQLSSRVGSCIAAGLRRLGLPARENASGGVEIDGYKVSGSSGGFEGRTMIMQGTILIDFDHEEMAGLLKAGANAPKPPVRVASLRDFLGRSPPIEDVRAALSAELSSAWPETAMIADLDVDELTLADDLFADKIGTDAFVAGREDDVVQSIRAVQRPQRTAAP